ncbi:hypothetical protein M513_08458, partial [Trichuris suis]
TSWPELENYLEEWVKEQRQNGYVVTRGGLKAQAMRWAKLNEPLCRNFKATSGWCSRFMKRKDLVLRQKTKIAQKLPADLDDKVLDFQRYVIRLRRELSSIGNMDETPINFDMVAHKTVDSKGVKSVLLRSTGHEKTRFIVVLSCLADGTKLKPMVIFKRKRDPTVRFPCGVFVHFHENGVKLWIDNVWRKRLDG